jgi:transcriptional/translational regulatory protein YebC/TACO1
VFHVDPAGETAEERLTEIALDAGADDLAVEGDGFAIYCRPAAFTEVKTRLDGAKVLLRGAELAYVPNQRSPVADAAVARRVVRLLDALDDNDDVQSVHSNEDFSDDVMRSLEQKP